MKDGVVIVNTARGAVIDEAALVAALDSGKVRSVGLDVFEEEPTVHPGLLSNPNVMLIPHMGTFTVEVRIQLDRLLGPCWPLVFGILSSLLTCTTFWKSCRHKPKWNAGI